MLLTIGFYIISIFELRPHPPFHRSWSQSNAQLPLLKCKHQQLTSGTLCEMLRRFRVTAIYEVCVCWSPPINNLTSTMWRDFEFVVVDDWLSYCYGMLRGGSRDMTAEMKARRSRPHNRVPHQLSFLIHARWIFTSGCFRSYVMSGGSLSIVLRTCIIRFLRSLPLCALSHNFLSVDVHPISIHTFSHTLVMHFGHVP